MRNDETRSRFRNTPIIWNVKINSNATPDTEICLGRPFRGTSRHWHYRLHLIRKGTFSSIQVHRCSHVIICFTGLNSAVAKGHRWIHRRIDFCVCPSGRTCPIHVVADNRCTRARIPRKINGMLNRCTRPTGSFRS